MHIFLSILSSFVFLFSFKASADQLDAIKKKGEIVVGILGTDEPNSFVDPKTREFVGYEVDLAQEIANAMGVKVKFKQLSVAARIPEIQQDRVDLLAATLTHTKEREAQIDFSITTFVTGQRIMVKASSGIKDIADLKGKKVLTAKGGTQEPNARKAIPNVQVVTFENAQQAFLALQQGKGVGYVNDETSLLSDLAKLGENRKNFILLPTSISIEPLALGIKKGEARLKAQVDQTLKSLEKNGKAEELFQKWFGPQSKVKIEKRTFKFDTDKIETSKSEADKI